MTIPNHFQVEKIVPGTLSSSVTGPVVLVVSKADGDEEVGKFFCIVIAHSKPSIIGKIEYH